MQEINNEFCFSKYEFYAFQAADGSKSFIYGYDYSNEIDEGDYGWTSEKSCYPSISLYTSIARFNSFEEAEIYYDKFDDFMKTQVKIVKIIINVMVEDAK
jgi:hypothetical protein